MTRVAQQSQMPLINHLAAADPNEVTFQKDFSIANHYLNAHKLREQLRQTQEAMALVEASNEDFNKELMLKQQQGLTCAQNDIITSEWNHSNLSNKEMQQYGSNDLDLNSQPFVGTNNNNKLVTMAVGSRIESFMTESLYNITTKFNHSLQNNQQEYCGAELEKLRLVGKSLKLSNKVSSASTQPETYAPRTELEDNGTHHYDSDSSFDDNDIPVNQLEKTCHFGLVDSTKKYGKIVNDRSKSIKKAIVAKTTILFSQKKSPLGKVLTKKRQDLVKVQIGNGFNQLRDQTVQNMQFKCF